MKHESFREVFPTYFMFGDSHKFLTNEEAILATRDERIKSVWPKMVRMVRGFQATLKEIERANFDAEDCLNEIWIALAENDKGWDATRGNYVSYASVIAKCRLEAIRDASRVVRSPRNSLTRIKDYERQKHTLSEGQRKTFDDIRRTMVQHEQIDAYASQIPGESDEDQPNPDKMLRHHKGIMKAVRKFSPMQRYIITRLYGLDGKQPTKITALAAETRRRVGEIRRLKAQFQEILIACLSLSSESPA